MKLKKPTLQFYVITLSFCALVYVVLFPNRSPVFDVEKCYFENGSVVIVLDSRTKPNIVTIVCCDKSLPSKLKGTIETNGDMMLIAGLEFTIHETYVTELAENSVSRDCVVVDRFKVRKGTFQVPFEGITNKSDQFYALVSYQPGWGVLVKID